LLSTRSSDHSLTNTPIIPLSSGIVLAKISGCFIHQLITIQESSISLLSISAKHHETSARKKSVMFLTSNLKEKYFLDLLDNKHNTIVSSYIKGGPWIKHFGHSNLLCARVTRAITNHALIDEYCLRFFPNEYFSCSCRSYSALHSA